LVLAAVALVAIPGLSSAVVTDPKPPFGGGGGGGYGECWTCRDAGGGDQECVTVSDSETGMTECLEFQLSGGPQHCTEFGTFCSIVGAESRTTPNGEPLEDLPQAL
jgi:hypothetical protein